MYGLPPSAQMVRPASSIYIVLTLPSFGLALVLLLVGQPNQFATFLLVIFALIISIARHRLTWDDDGIVYRRIFSTIEVKRAVISKIAVSSRKPLIPLFPLSSYLHVFTTASDVPAFSINLALFSPQDVMRFTDYVQHHSYSS